MKQQNETHIRGLFWRRKVILAFKKKRHWFLTARLPATEVFVSVLSLPLFFIIFLRWDVVADWRAISDWPVTSNNRCGPWAIGDDGASSSCESLSFAKNITWARHTAKGVCHKRKCKWIQLKKSAMHAYDELGEGMKWLLKCDRKIRILSPWYHSQWYVTAYQHFVAGLASTPRGGGPLGENFQRRQRRNRLFKRCAYIQTLCILSWMSPFQFFILSTTMVTLL